MSAAVEPSTVYRPDTAGDASKRSGGTNLSYLVRAKRIARIAAAILVALMVGALATHAVQAEFQRFIPPVLLGGLALLLYSSRRR